MDKNKLLKFMPLNAVHKVKEIEEFDLELYVKAFSPREKMKATDVMESSYNMSLKELKEEENANITNVGQYDYMVGVCNIGLCDENGNKLFEDLNEQLDILYSFPIELIGKIFNQIVEVNGMEGNDSVKKPLETSEETTN